MPAHSLCHGHREQAQSLHNRALRAGHRYAIALVGSRNWSTDSAAELVLGHDLESGLWVASSRDNPFTVPDHVYLPASEARHHLGKEYGYVVFDLHGAIDPDALGILGSTIVAGGVLVLLIPGRLEGKETVADTTGSLYLERFYRRLEHHDVLLIQESHDDKSNGTAAQGYVNYARAWKLRGAFAKGCPAAQARDRYVAMRTSDNSSARAELRRESRLAFERLSAAIIQQEVVSWKHSSFL